MKAMNFALLLTAAFFLAACGGGGAGTGGVTGAALSSISISPNTTDIPAGLTQQYAVQAMYADGTTQAVAGAVFTSSNTNVATVLNSAGTVKALTTGTSTIAATYSGQTATAALNVTPVALISVSISPEAASIAVGATQQFTVTGHYSDETTQVIVATNWSSSSLAAANINGTGLSTAVSAGNSNITVAYGGLTATTSLTVTPATLQSITITPASASIVSLTTQQFSATGNYSDGSSLAINNPAWSSSLTSVATINSAGLATAGSGSGVTDITATYGGKSASVPLTVSLATPVSMTLTARNGAATTLPLSGSIFYLDARIQYSNGTSQWNSANAIWTSSNTNVGTIFGVWGGVMPVGVGTTTITVTDAGFSASIDITFTAPVPVASYINGITSGTYAKRTEKQLSASIQYSKGADVAATSVAWSSSNTNVFTVDATGLFKGVGAGTATLTLTADGFISTRNITIVDPVASPTITVTCNATAPMTLSADVWNTAYALDPKNATEWAKVDPASCAAYSYVVLVFATPSNLLYATLEAPRYSASVYGPAITNTSTMTPQLSSGTAVDVGYKTTSPSFGYSRIYAITAAP